MIPAKAAARKGPGGRYPLHYLVWHNRPRELEDELRQGQVSQAAVGAPRGLRAPQSKPGWPAGRPAWAGGAARAVPPPQRLCSRFFVLGHREG